LQEPTTIEATDTITTNANTIVTIEKINTAITLVAKRRTSRKIPTRREMTTNTIVMPVDVTFLDNGGYLQ
jgi:hypothetical protein